MLRFIQKFILCSIFITCLGLCQSPGAQANSFSFKNITCKMDLTMGKDPLGVSYATDLSMEIDGTITEGKFQGTTLDHNVECYAYTKDLTETHYKCTSKRAVNIKLEEIDTLQERLFWQEQMAKADMAAKEFEFHWKLFGKKEWVCQYVVQKVMDAP